jgi:hypothetical protein
MEMTHDTLHLQLDKVWNSEDYEHTFKFYLNHYHA